MADAALVDALQPWLGAQVLRRLGRRSERNDEAEAAKGLVWVREEDFGAMNERFEALELLALLQGVDMEAWKKGVLEAWGAQHSDWVGRTGVPLRIGHERGVIHRHGDNFEPFFLQLASMFMPNREYVASEGYAQVHARLEEMYAASASPARDQVCIPVELFGSGSSVVEHVEAYHQAAVMHAVETRRGIERDEAGDRSLS